MQKITWHNEKRKISDLIPAGYNPRKLDDKHRNDLEASLSKFNMADPVVINLNNTIIGGHMRLRVLAAKGVEEVDVRVPSVLLDSEMEKELNLRLNKNLGEWDFDLLGEFSLDMLKDVGFESSDLDKIFKVAERPDDDEIPEEVPAVAKRGQIWQLGRHRIMCGDATEGSDLAVLMGENRASMVMTDPPYNIDYKGGIHADGTQTKRKKILNDKMSSQHFYEFLFKVCINLINYTSGAFYICMSSGELHNLWKAFTDAGGHWQEYVIWSKDHFTLSRTDYQQSFEPILHGLTFDAAKEIEENYEASDGEAMLYGWTKHEFYGGRKQGNVWHFDRPKRSKEHPTMKPVMLCAKAIINSSKQGQIILDAFLGSGSTLIACEKANRICFGMELDPYYVDVIIKRWENFTGCTALLIDGDMKHD